MKMLQTQTAEADSISSSNRATAGNVACKPLPSVVYRRVVAQHPLQVPRIADTHLTATYLLTLTLSPSNMHLPQTATALITQDM